MGNGSNKGSRPVVKSSSMVKQLVRMIIAIVIVSGMVFVAECIGEKEVIFPEVAALVIGALVLEKQPWNVDKLTMILLMSLSAIVGVIIVRYIKLPLFIQLFVGIIYAGTALILSHTSMLPLISACILPIIMGTESYIYVVAVVVLSVLIVLLSIFFEKIGLLENKKIIKNTDDKIEITDNVKENINENKPSGKVEIKSSEAKLMLMFEKWFLIVLAFMIIAVAAINTYQIFVIAPPLIVTFAAVCEKGNPAAKRPFVLWFVIVLCSITGAIGRMACIATGLRGSVIIIIVMILVFLIMKLCKCMFPPAGALAVLPLIISSEKVIIYPLQVAVGCMAFLIIGKIISGYTFE